MNRPMQHVVGIAAVIVLPILLILALNYSDQQPPQTFPAAGCFELRTTDSTRVGEGPDATERWQTVERVEWVCP